MRALRSRLSKAGVSRAFLDKVVLPDWWNDSIATIPSGFREAAGFICAHLGFSLASLLDASLELSFSERGAVKYKKSRGVADSEVGLATHYALGVARAMAAGWASRGSASPVPSPTEWRERLLSKSKGSWVCLGDLLSAALELGIPILHLRTFPTHGKKPDALATMVGNRPVIVVLSQRKSPAWLSFIVAHELGHLHHRHLTAGQTLVDEKMGQNADETEEKQANEFASRLLTGQSDLGLYASGYLTSANLAKAARKFGEKYRIAPGVAALNYGFTTGRWAVATAAVTVLEKREDAAAEFHSALADQLKLSELSEDSLAWITRATCGG